MTNHELLQQYIILEKYERKIRKQILDLLSTSDLSDNTGSYDDLHEEHIRTLQQIKEIVNSIK